MIFSSFFYFELNVLITDMGFYLFFLHTTHLSVHRFIFIFLHDLDSMNSTQNAPVRDFNDNDETYVMMSNPQL